MTRIFFDRYSLTGQEGLFRPANKAVSTRHMPGEVAPLPPTWWQSVRLFQVHDMRKLHDAVYNGDLAAVRRELSHPRCDPNIELGDRLPALFTSLRTPWSTGVMSALLADERLNLELRPKGQGRTALEQAVSVGFGPHVTALLKAGAQLAPTRRVAAAIEQSANQGTKTIATPGVNVHATSGDGRSLLTMAAAAGNLPLLRGFLDECPVGTVDTPDKRGMTALGAAMQAGQTRAVALLLRAGASADRLDAQRHTPLWHAVDQGRADLVEMLLKVSATPQVTGLAAMEHAIARNDFACVEALVRHRAVDWTLPGLGGELHLKQLARDSGNRSLTALLDPARLWVAKHLPHEIASALLAQTDPQERTKRLQALAAEGDLSKIRPLADHTALQGDLARTTDTLAFQQEWQLALRLVHGFDLGSWQPSATLLGALFKADPGHGTATNPTSQDGPRHRVARHAGAALLKALERDPGLARAWQGPPADTPSTSSAAAPASVPDPALAHRLAAIVVAAVHTPGLDVGATSTLATLFRLDDVAPAQRAGVARAVLEALGRCPGPGGRPLLDSAQGSARALVLALDLHAMHGAA